MIIKAGTYRFNDEVDYLTFDVGINFTADFTYEGATYKFSFSKISRISGSLIIEGLISGISPVPEGFTEEDIVGGSLELVKFTNSTTVYAWYIQFITVTEDTDVDDTSGTWFTSNTTMLIKAGTYKFHDVVDIDTALTFTTSAPMNFSIPSKVLVEAKTGFYGELVVSRVFDHIQINDDKIAYIYTEGSYKEYLYPLTTLFPTYNWVALLLSIGFALNLTIEALAGIGQIINVNDDAYVPIEWGTWLTSSWEEYVEPEPSDLVNIKYGDDVIGSLRQGRWNATVETENKSLRKNLRLESQVKPYPTIT